MPIYFYFFILKSPNNYANDEIIEAESEMSK